MALIITSDLHMTDRLADEYRWPIFPWLKESAAKNQCIEVLLLGDITDAKDHHPSRLVNRLCEALFKLSEEFTVIWLSGNHDFLGTANEAFFRFLDSVDNIRFIKVPRC